MMGYEKTKAMRMVALCLALALLGALFAPQLAGASGGNPPAGNNQYVSLHKYASKTDSPGVYKVTLDVSNNQKQNVEPVFITFVLDASPSMYLSHLTDNPLIAGTDYSRMPTMAPTVDKVSRWEGAWAGLRAALDIFGSPTDNLAYEHTYVSIVAFDGYNARVFTNNAKQGWYFEKTAGDHLSNVEMPNFLTSELTAGYTTAARTSSSMIGAGITPAYRAAYPANGLGGFVNISGPGMYNASANTRGRILESVPRYPLITQDIISNHWGANPTNPLQNTYWWLDTNGTSTRHGMEAAYNLMEATYSLPDINGVQNEDFQRFVIFLGDGNDQSGAYSQFANSTGGEYYAAALKAPRGVMMGYNGGSKEGLNTQVWTIGMGLTATGADSEYYLAQGAAATLIGSVGNSWRNGSLYEDFLNHYALTGTEIGDPTWSTTADASYTEPHLISMAAELNNKADYANFPTVTFNTGSTSNNDLRNIFNFYRTYGVDKTNTVYEHAAGGYPGATGGKNAVDIFREYAQRIVVGSNIKVTDKIGSSFTITNYGGKPSFELFGTAKAGGGKWDPGTVSIDNGVIKWDIPAIPNDGGKISLSYYVQLDPAANPDLYYETNAYAYIEYDRKGILELNEDPDLDYHVVKSFPMPYISPKNGEKVEDDNSRDSSTPGGSGSGGASSSTGSGADGHQDNRKDRDETAGGLSSGFGGGLADVDPKIVAVKAGKDASGRDRVSVELSNGAYMRFQWQFKNAAGEWEDIFGANGSHYTLGKQFTLGKEYLLRCRITNPVGKIVYTDEVKAVRNSETSGLQESGPGIAGENVMDAGEEISVVDTATNGHIFLLFMTVVVLAVSVKGLISLSRRYR